MIIRCIILEWPTHCLCSCLPSASQPILYYQCIQSLMQLSNSGQLSEQSNNLSSTQLRICEHLSQFMRNTSKQLEEKLADFQWQEYLLIIANRSVDESIRIVSCSALKMLMYNKKFMHDPRLMFEELFRLYLVKEKEEEEEVSRVQATLEVIMSTISSLYFSKEDKWSLAEQLFSGMKEPLTSLLRALKVVLILVETLDVDSLNNEVLVGEVFLLLEKVLEWQKLDQLRVKICREAVKIVDTIIEIIDEQEDISENMAEMSTRVSQRAKAMLMKIITSHSTSHAHHTDCIITADPLLNEVKAITLSLYRRIWMFDPDQQMFRLLLSTLLRKPAVLMDFEVEIMESVVVMMERALGQPAYQTFIHAHTQPIIFSLLSMLTPKQSYLALIESSPEEFVQIEEDFSMQQEMELLSTKVGSLIASLCLTIDGYLSFLCSMGIMIIKFWSDPKESRPSDIEYINTIQSIWECPQQQKLATCILVLAALSDQIEKRKDLYNPLMNMIFLLQENYNFKVGECDLPPLILCRFMLLYAFFSYPNCMKSFLPYKSASPVYEHQLQSCYKIMTRYASRRKGIKQYLNEVGAQLVLSERLTPALENTIYNNPELLPHVQYQALERLVLWLDQAYDMQNILTCNKISSLLVKLIEEFSVQDYSTCEQQIYTYLEPLLRKVFASQHPAEQNIVELAVTHVRKFPCLHLFTQRTDYFLTLAYTVTTNNHYVLNSCFQLLGELVTHLTYQQITSLMGVCLEWVHNVQQGEDVWDYVHVLEVCALKVGQLGQPIPTVSRPTIQWLVEQAKSPCLSCQIGMFLYSLAIFPNSNQPEVLIYLSDKLPPSCIPPYLNKPLCFYLINLSVLVEYGLQNLCLILQQIVDLLQKEQTIGRQIQEYEDKLYEFSLDVDELAISAYSKSKTFMHPLLAKNVDLYDQLRKMWGKLPNKDEIRNLLKEGYYEQIVSSLQKQMVHEHARKIYRVKKPTMDEQV